MAGVRVVRGDTNGEDMASTKAGAKRALKRRRIIERPRLISLLDESPARVRTLIAPAGYGKTTLADQWIAKGGRRGAWFTLRPSSTDVAALALGLARAATAVIAGCDVRLREHLRALPAPAEHVDVLADLLGEDLADWPSDAWLVLDDYQEIVGRTDAEKFVEALLAESPIQLLITSRQRPSWITMRRILYGEILELNQTELAMDGHEAAEVLADRNAASASGLVALASGWPAVIGLASVTEAEIGEQESVPESLYQFFAEEVYGALEDEVQTGLATLAIAPLIDHGLATRLLSEDAERICATALDVGILVERDGRFEIHPLARAFLENTRETLATSVTAAAVAECISHFRERRDWDAAFDVIVRHGEPAQVESLLGDALDELLETARLSTIDSWCDHAGTEPPIPSLARAEVALRRGRLVAAQAHAESVTTDRPEIQFRALSVAGRAAHLSSREEEALALFERAEAIAPTDELRRESLIGQVSCLTDLERPDALAMVEELAASASPSSPRDTVRVADRRLYVQMKLAALDLAEADRAFEVLGAIHDPLVKSSFLSVYASVLALTARYREAFSVANALLELSQEYRLDFAIPYGQCSAGIAEAGQRKWEAAQTTFNHGIDVARAGSNVHGEQACLAALVRSLTQQGRWDEALELVSDHSRGPARPVLIQMRAEFVASEALALGASGNLDDAIRTVNSVRGLSQSIDAKILITAVDAVVSVKRHNADAIDRVNELVDVARATGGYDHLVTAYRAVPEILAILLRAQPEVVGDIVRQVGDEDLAQPFGYTITHGRATALLTARERDVLALVREGLTNREIATLLYIAEPTVKLHVQHIFDKLGVRSRKAIAMQAALERSNQATSAIDDTGVGTDS
jgi:ATP/maltotriose-dependent transcriptional regulator MalT